MKNHIRFVFLFLSLVFIFSCGGGNSGGGFMAGFGSAQAGGEGGVGEVSTRAVDSLIVKDKRSEEDPKIIREPVDFGATTVNYFSLDDIDTGSLVIADDGRPLTVEDYSPTGPLPRENRKPVVYVSFSHAMVPLSKLGAPMKEHPYLSINPAVAGTFRWYGTKTISFEPAEPLASQQEYSVTVSRKISSLGKKQLAEDFRFSFETEPLDIADMRPGTYDEVWTDLGNVPPTHSGSILLSFTEPVDPEYIRSFLSVKAGGSEVPFEIARPESSERELDENYISRSLQLSLTEVPPADIDITLTLAKGAASKPGNNGTEERLTRSYHTLLPFAYVEKSTYSHAFPRSRTGTINPVFITLNQPVQEEGAADLISTSFGPLDGWEEKIEIWKNVIRINDLPVEYGQSYEITLQAGLSDIYGQSLAADETITVDVPEAASYAYFPGGSSYRASDYNHRMLEAQFRPRIIYEYQNIDAGRMAINTVPSLYANKTAGIDYEDLDFSIKMRNAANYEIMDLSPWLNEEGFGSVQLNWFFENPGDGKYARDYIQNLVVQVTDLGLTMRYAYNKIIVWVNSLSSGAPVQDAEVEIDLGGSRRSMRTDEQGLVVFPLSGRDNKSIYNQNRHARFNRPLTVRVNGDRADFLPVGTHSPYHFGVRSGGGPYSGDDPTPVSFFFTDRGLYKPGEKLTFRGIDRNLRLGEFTAYIGRYNLEVKKREWRAKPFITLSGITTVEGGFYGEIEVPEDLEPGEYELRYKRQSQSRYESVIFFVKHFRRLNFQLEADVPDRVYYHGDTIAVPVEASYLAGGAMANADYRYFWTRQPTYFHPDRQKYGDWVFGPGHSGGTRTLSYKRGKLNAAGVVRAEQETGDENIAGQPFRYVLETKVEDIDRQEVASRVAVTVHPGAFYIGTKLSSGVRGYWSRFVEEGRKQTAQMVLVSPEGGPVDEEMDINVELIKRSWKTSQQQGVYGRINTQYTRVDETIATKTVRYAGEGTEVDFTPDEAGSYILRLSAVDRAGRSIVTDLNLYATGASWIRWANTGASDINLIVDKSLYQVGDTARILVQSPLPDGDYLMTVEREGIFEERIVTFTGSSGVLELPVTEAHVPVIYVALSSQQERTSTAESYFDPDLGKPKGYFGLATINVSTKTREMEIEVEQNKKIYEPGQEAEVELKVTQDGKPVADAELIFLAVDRGVLDLIDYHVPNPLTYFYDPDNFKYAVAGDDSRRLLLDPVTYDVSELQGGDNEKLKRREDFIPLAVFEPFLKTDKNGIARVTFELPDTLTTYRSTAIALRENKIGYTESEFVVQNPINVRTALPRRLRFRDTTSGGVILQNLDSVDHEVSVSLRATGISIGDSGTKTVTVPAGSSYELSYLLMAEEAGEAEMVFTIRSDVISEELVQRIEVEQPLVKESFSTIGGTDSFAEEAVVLPSAIQQGYGGISFQLDSTRIPLVREPVRRLLEYRIAASTFLLPYGYHALPVMVFPDAIEHIMPGTGKTPESTGGAYFQRAANYQWSDGGIRISSNSISSSPRASLQTAQLLQLAASNSLTNIVSERLDQEGLYGYLRELASDEETALYFRSWAVSLLAGAEAKNGAASDAGDGGSGTGTGNRADNRADAAPDLQGLIETLKAREDSLGLSGYAYLALAMLDTGDEAGADALWQRMKNFLAISTRSIDLEETYEATGYFDSEVEQLALILRVAMRMDEGDDFIRRLAESLGRRIQTERWLSYSDCEAATIAFGDVYKTESGTATGFTSKVILAGSELFSAPFEGVSEGPVSESFAFSEGPLNTLDQNKPYTMRFEKEGEGELFYTSTIEYALPSEIVTPRDEGLSVYTVIETLDGEEVAPEELELGKTYRCRAFITSNRDRTLLTLSVPVPSGAEIIDSDFVTSSTYGDEGGVTSEEWTRETVHGDRQTFIGEGIINFSYNGWWIHYYRPEMLVYDNEMMYQWEYFYKGERRVSFLFKTTTPGIYPTPPAQAKLLTEPEVFGRTGGDLFVIQ